VIAIDQDPLGKQGSRVWHSEAGDQEIWTRPLADGSVAVALFNRGAAAASMKVLWADIGLSKHGSATDVWTSRRVDASAPEYEATVPSHGVVMLRVSR